MKRIHVVAAIIHGDCCDKSGQIFIARRADHLHKGGLWEFPGGKVDAGETPRQALVRELREELAIETRACKKLVETHHDYPDKQIHIEFWEVTDFDGEPIGNEGQPVEWVRPENLADYEFPEANQAIVNRLARESLSDASPQVIHKGYIWTLAAVLMGAAWFYLSDETRGYTGQQKFYYWALKEQSTVESRELARRYTILELEQLCRYVDQKHKGYLSDFIGEAKPGLTASVAQAVASDICGAYIYKLKLDKIENQEFGDLTF